VIKKFTLLGILCLCSGLVLGLGANDLITVYMNGKPLETTPDARIENGISLAPIRSIAEALGAKVSWNSELQEIYLERNSWLEVDHEPTFGNTYPFDTKALGPILDLRHYLSEQQWGSIQKQTADQPFLARFEIIDARSSISPPDFTEESLKLDTANLPNLGFRLTAILYWAYSDTTLIQSSVITKKKTVEGVSIAQIGTSFNKVRVDVMQYDLEPNDGKIEDERVVLGAGGWKVKELEPSEVLLTSGEILPATQTFDVMKGNTILPFYDLSALLLQ
jgi:Copper amine oxidase N-terminal domain